MNDPGLILLGKALAVLALLLVNGLFVAAECAFVKLRETQLEPLRLKGHRRAQSAHRVVSRLQTFISATQLGITLCSLALGALIEPFYEALLAPVFGALAVKSETVRHTSAILFGFLSNTILLIVIGELAPKGLALRKTLPTALWIAPWLERFSRLTYPFIWVLNRLAELVLARFGLDPAGVEEFSHSEEELRLLVSTAQRQAGATLLGRNIVLNAMDLRHRVAREVMRSRQEIVGLNTEATIERCLELAERTRFSRLPLCEQGELDRMLGVVHIKDLYALRHKAKTGLDLLPAAKKIIYVPPTARLEKLLQLLLDRKLHMAIVVDEYGGTLGMITLENILEELVGQIQDEFDQEKPLLIKTGEHTWEADGILPLHELAELTQEPLTGDDIATASGWLTQKLGGFPKEDDAVMLANYELRVLEIDGMRVARFRISRVTPGGETTG